MTKLKNDKYRKVRGGRSKILTLSCEKCGARLFHYQKDGPGILKRLYRDRMNSLSKYTGFFEKKSMEKTTKLVCRSCKELLGLSVMYKKEKRPAYRLFAGAVRKEKS